MEEDTLKGAVSYSVQEHGAERGKVKGERAGKRRRAYGVKWNKNNNKNINNNNNVTGREGVRRRTDHVAL